MPAGVPTATFAIGPAGATNAALFVIRMLALDDAELGRKLAAFRDDAAQKSVRSSAELKAEITLSTRPPSTGKGLPRPRATPAPVPRRRRGKPGR